MRKLFAFFSAALVLAACAVKEEVPAPKAKVFTATIEDTNTRTYIWGGPSIYWENSQYHTDRISVFDRNQTNLKYTIASGVAETTATFTTEDTPSTARNLDKVYAIYPWYGGDDGNRVGTDGTMTAYLSYQQYFLSDGVMWFETPMVAVSENENLQFKNAVGFLALNLYGDATTAIDRIVIQGNLSEFVAGDLVVTMGADGTPKVSPDEDSDYLEDRIELYVNYEEAMMPVYLNYEEGAYTSFWIAIPPTNFRYGITVKVYGTDGRLFMKSTTKPLKIERSVCTPTAPLKVEFPQPDFDLPVIYEEDFETPEGDSFAGSEDWTFQDNDGDGFFWSYVTPVIGAHSGSGVLFSNSWVSGTGPLTPDNWAITPAIDFTTDNYLSVWVAASDQDEYEEHYAVYITDKNPKETPITAADCTLLLENTFPEGNKVQVDMVPDAWGYDIMHERFMLRIPAEYAGKTAYIAFRHFNCTDNFMLFLDDICVTEGNPLASGQVSSAPRKQLQQRPAHPAPDWGKKVCSHRYPGSRRPLK